MFDFAKRRSGTQDQKKKEQNERKRSILYLVLDYLKEHNLHASFETLKQEAQLTDQYVVCDNVNLDMIFQEFYSYYNVKFQRDPRIIRKNLTDIAAADSVPLILPKKKSAVKSRTRSEKPMYSSSVPSISANDFHMEIISIESQDKTAHERIGTADKKPLEISSREKKPLSDYSGYTQEWREMADQIMKEFIPNTLGYSWDNCIGLQKPIELLKEATVYPIEYPELFRNLRCSSWNGILLYGPPGTGKTLLAKALACETRSNFINITISTFVSKWRGESEKMLKVAFDLAKFYAPTTIFIDEIDALLSETKETNHEASCRFKSELLIQMDGLLSTSKDPVFILATTNTPWKLDKALLRRFEKRILIPLPSDEAKKKMFEQYADLNEQIKIQDMENLTKLTENFSGCDVRNACKEMEMSLIRERLKEMNLKKKPGSLRMANFNDLTTAVKSVKPSIQMEYYKKLLEWHSEFGHS